jgi:regulator of protease activity HflC (stomatin/prohibitin superfamily)
MFRLIEIREHERGVQYRWGKFLRMLEPGVYFEWPLSGRKTVRVDTRRQALQIRGQETQSADRIPVGLNLLVWYRVTDPVAALHEVDSYADALHQAVQLAAREAVGERELEDVMAAREAMAAEITETARDVAAEFGVEVHAAFVKDITLDYEMQAAYRQKLVADQRGQAELVAARHEVAAARARANAAKLTAETPQMLAARQLDVLEKAAEGGMNRFVIVAPEIADRLKLDEDA